MQARVVRREEDRAAANAVEVGDLHQGFVVVDRVVRVARAAVRADVEIGVATRLPIATVGRKFAGFDPVSLLEAQDLHPGLGEAPSNCGTRSARADNEYIDDLISRSCAVGICFHGTSPSYVANVMP